MAKFEVTYLLPFASDPHVEVVEAFNFYVHKDRAVFNDEPDQPNSARNKNSHAFSGVLKVKRLS